MGHHFLEHDAGALVHREMRDSGADGGERDRPKTLVLRDLEAAAGRAAQALGAGPPAQSHARRMDDVASLQRARAGDGGISDLDRADAPALGLDLRPSGARDRTGDATS